MQNKISEGKTLRYTNSSGNTIVAGTPIYLGGNIAGVAVDDIPHEATGVLEIGGVYDLPKTTTAITAGDLVEIDSGEVKTLTVTTTAHTLLIAGVALESANTAAETVKIYLKS